MGFTLKTIRDNQVKVFSIQKILEILGEKVNDEILIDGKSYRISSFISTGGGSGEEQTTVCQTVELFASKDDQFQFSINEIISNSSNINLFINGIRYTYGISKSYHISGGNLIWHGDFDLETTDEIIVKYSSII